MAKPRLYLFHGNDSRTSSVELQRWLQVFLAKYGETTQYILHSDELTFDEFHQRLQQALETQSLFPEPKFVLVKRMSSALTAARVKDVLKTVSSQLAGLNDQVTVVFWEDTLVPTSHGLHVWFTEHANKKQAEIKVYRVAPGHALVDGLVAKSGLTLDREAMTWLDLHARRLEREQRTAGKLRSTDEIASDWRVWVLQNLVESAGLLADSATVRVGHLEQAAGVIFEPVSPFEIINAVQANSWTRARQLARLWDRGDEGAYFSLVALLRNHFRRQAEGGLNAHALELLAEFEILSKNVSLRSAWLIDLFFLRCQAFRGDHLPLLAPRRLWLSHIQRVD